MPLGLRLAAANEATLVLSSPPRLIHPVSSANTLRRTRVILGFAGRGVVGGLDRLRGVLEDGANLYARRTAACEQCSAESTPNALVEVGAYQPSVEVVSKYSHFAI